ncbi:MAG: HEAT repeat domain-containing protein [Candidatus Dormibacteraeota bacterium]|nr:HEAT repeat domain-containing protein [Candidatus Dormibacteraeota bacterium]MDQ6921096.1 HEAT repeat domain-containing protein [Candidatus Dormibacteraeota bacterium]
MSDLESERPVKRPGGSRAGIPRSRLATRVDRILSAALAGEPEVTLNIKAAELLGDAGPVAATIRDLIQRGAPGVIGQWRIDQALRPTGVGNEILNSLVDPDPSVRISAARLCGALRMTDSLPWLADLIGDAKPKVREAAIRALGELGGSRAVDVLMSAVDRLPQHRLAIELAHAASDMDIEALIREPASVQSAVVTVLACGLRHDRLRVGPLAGIVRDRRWPPRVRSAACRALAMIGDPATVAGLQVLTADPDAEVRLAAAKALRRFRPASGQA